MEKTDINSDLYKIRHSLAHVLAQAVLQIRPDAKLGFGPPIDSGFARILRNSSVSDSAVCVSAKYPFSPCRIISGRHPVGNATTGVATEKNSTATLQMTSDSTELTTPTSANPINCLISSLTVISLTCASSLNLRISLWRACISGSLPAVSRYGISNTKSGNSFSN